MTDTPKFVATGSTGHDNSVASIETSNEHGVSLHMRLGWALRTLYPVDCRTKQSAYRLAAWLMSMADALPDEPGAELHSWEDVKDAIRNT